MLNLMMGNNCKFLRGKYEGKSKMWFLFAKMSENCRIVEYSGTSFIDLIRQAEEDAKCSIYGSK